MKICGDNMVERCRALGVIYLASEYDVFLSSLLLQL